MLQQLKKNILYICGSQPVVRKNQNMVREKFQTVVHQKLIRNSFGTTGEFAEEQLIELQKIETVRTHLNLILWGSFGVKKQFHTLKFEKSLCIIL